MNSRIEVSQNIVAILGSETSSEFRLNRIRESLSLDKSSDVCAREIYFLKLRKDSSYVSEEDYKQLSDLLVGSDIQDIVDKSFFLLTPRIGTISPWSSKATEIIGNCGIDFVERVERGLYYSFTKKIQATELLKMGNIRPSFIKSRALLLVEMYPDKFNADFDNNKVLVAQYSDVSNKRMRNWIAGYITRYVQRRRD